MSVTIISRTRSFARNHRRTDWVLGRAARTERRAISRFFDAAHDFAADAVAGFDGHCGRQSELFRGVIVRQLGPQAPTALRNRAETTPVAVLHRERLLHQGASRLVSLGTNGTGVGVLDFGAS